MFVFFLIVVDFCCCNDKYVFISINCSFFFFL